MNLRRLCCFHGNNGIKQVVLFVIVVANFLTLILLLTSHAPPSWLQWDWDEGSELPPLGKKDTPPHILRMMVEKNFAKNLDVPISKNLKSKNREMNFDPWSDEEGYVALPLRFGDMTEDEIENAGWMEMTKYAPETPLNFTPPVPRYSVSDVVYRLNDSIMQRNLALDRRKYENHSIVILTPIHNSERHLVQFGQLISGLDYPKSKISVVFGEDSSKDETLSMADHVLKALKKEGFKRTEVHHFNITGQVGEGWENKHRRISQYKRRRHLANARNLLLKAGLEDEEYALWIDVDIGYLPSDLIQQMIFTNKDVVTPCCLYRKQNQIRIYDKNTWRETKMSLSEQEKLPKNAVIVEGYGPTTRIFLPHLQGEGRAVPIDGVGGCSLLVRAECHRKGLDFPETPYRRHLETEGLAKKATDMGFKVYGLPFLQVFHR